MGNNTSLYSRLLKNKNTEERSNLENFLTEMLCDFLNRISTKETKEFLRQVLNLTEEEPCLARIIDNPSCHL